MSCQCRRNCPARAFIGFGRECIIHERNALDPASAFVRLALSAWMSCRRSRIPHALAVFDRRFAGSRLTSGCGSVRLDSFPGHRYFVRLSGGLSLASALRALSTASLACLTTWNPSMILAALGEWPRMALGESRAHVARHQAHAVRVAVERHEIPCEPFDGMRGLDLPGAVTLMAVAPDRVHVAGDRVHPPGFGMFDHPVVGGAGNARYPALRRYRVAGGVGPYHCYFRANTGDACSETSTSLSNCLLRLRSSTGSFCSGGAVVGGFRGAAVADALDPTV